MAREKDRAVKPKETPNERRKIGGKFSRDDIDWDLAESFYIQGETYVEKGKKGDLVVRVPSYSDIGRRFNCSSSLVHYHAKKRNWREKRETFRRQQKKVIADEVIKARAFSMAEGHSILDRWLTMFDAALHDGKVRTDSISDFKTALHLKNFLLDQGSDGTEKGADEINLNDLQRAHKAHREQAAKMENATAGVLVDEKPPDQAH